MFGYDELSGEKQTGSNSYSDEGESYYSLRAGGWFNANYLNPEKSEGISEELLERESPELDQDVLEEKPSSSRGLWEMI